MVTYGKGIPADFADILDFANYVFSNAHRPHDFKELVPKMYGTGNAELAALHFVAKEDERIRSLVGLWPVDIQLGSMPLKLGVIGTVSVHPYDRGKGHMRKLMRMAIADARAQGMDIMTLGGQRQRYAYYGFESGGQRMVFEISAKNVHVRFPSAPADIAFEEVTDSADPRLDTIYSLYETQPVHGARPRDKFLIIAHTWNDKLYALMRAGECIGYMIGEFSEVVLADEADLPAVLKSWLKAGSAADKNWWNRGVNFAVGLHEQERMRMLSSFAEDCVIETDHRMLVLNPARVVETLLKFRNGFAPCKPGRAVVKLGTAECVASWPTLAINVDATQSGDGLPRITVAETDEPAEYTFEYVEGMAAFFGHCAPYNYLPGVLRDWLPLPLSIPGSDSF